MNLIKTNMSDEEKQRNEMEANYLREIDPAQRKYDEMVEKYKSKHKR